ncbi:MAG: phosphatidylglycerophosphatase A [Acidobacteriota bacterium]
MKRLAVAIATSGGAGFFPFAPGTVGSAVGVGIYMLTRHWSPVSQVALLAGITLVGTWASHLAAQYFDKEDPGYVVIDEVAGQLVTLLLLNVGFAGAIVGFLLFRVFDIIKPWPARRFEDLPGGIGIMADDLMAGVYGWIVMRGLLFALHAWR